MSRTLLPALLILCASAGHILAQNTATLALANPTAGSPGTVDVIMANSVAVAGFQFQLNGATIVSAAGGSAAAAGMSTNFNAGSGIVLGFSFTGSTIPVSPGTLLTRLQVTPAGTPICMSGVVISDPAANSVPTTVGPCITMPSLAVSPASVGNTFFVTLSSPSEPGALYICGFSAATSPGILLPDFRTIPLAYDALLALSTDPLNPIFLNTIGTLDGSGASIVSVLVPSVPSLAGLTLYTAFLTVNPAGSASAISSAAPLTIQ